MDVGVFLQELGLVFRRVAAWYLLVDVKNRIDE
jgi:hypothetical protein